MLALTSEVITEIYNTSRPRLVWLVDEKLLPRIRRVTDRSGQFMWSAGPLPKEQSAGRILGHEIVVTSAEDQIELAMIDGRGEYVTLRGATRC